MFGDVDHDLQSCYDCTCQPKARRVLEDVARGRATICHRLRSHIIDFVVTVCGAARAQRMFMVPPQQQQLTR